MSELERTEQATPKKRQQERAKGNVARSRDVVAAIGLLAATIALLTSARSNAIDAAEMMRGAFADGFVLDAADYNFGNELSALLLLVLRKLSGLFLIVLIAAVAGNVLQTGFLFLPKKAFPDFKRLSPEKNLRRLFSGESLLQTGAGLVKMALFFALVLLAIRRDAETFANLPFGAPIEIALFFLKFIGRVAYQFCAIAILIAVADYALKRWKYEQSLRMTQQELRDEIKEESGSPVAKSKRKEARSVLMSSVGAVQPAAPPKPVSKFGANRRQEEKREDDSSVLKPRR